MMSRRRSCSKARWRRATGPLTPGDGMEPKGSLFVTRPSLGHYTADREELLWRASDVLGWSAANELQIRIDDVLPLAEMQEAPAAARPCARS